ncbi:transposase [Salinibacter ruber]|uniref:transposase n=1 Tax=Salinibacter ruber TaxID=146919 RepID=UPI002167522B
MSRYFTTGRKRRYSLRYHVLDAILYIVKTGTQWRMLPGGFAPWQTVYYYFRRWREEGRILCILSITSRAVRHRPGRHGGPSALIIDCQSVPSTRVGGISSFDAFKKVNGRKRHRLLSGQRWDYTPHMRCRRAGVTWSRPEASSNIATYPDRWSL